jgi:hypothetical protein
MKERCVGLLVDCCERGAAAWILDPKMCPFDFDFVLFGVVMFCAALCLSLCLSVFLWFVQGVWAYPNIGLTRPQSVRVSQWLPRLNIIQAKETYRYVVPVASSLPGTGMHAVGS